MTVQGYLQLRNFKPDRMAVSDRYTVVGNYVILTKNVDKSVKFHQKFVKNSSKTRFFVKMTTLQCTKNHSEPPIGSGIKFWVCRTPWTAISGKIGGFRFKSPHREQILLLQIFIFLLAPLQVARYSPKSPI